MNNTIPFPAPAPLFKLEYRANELMNAHNALADKSDSIARKLDRIANNGTLDTADKVALQAVYRVRLAKIERQIFRINSQLQTIVIQENMRDAFNIF